MQHWLTKTSKKGSNKTCSCDTLGLVLFVVFICMCYFYCIQHNTKLECIWVTVVLCIMIKKCLIYPKFWPVEISTANRLISLDIEKSWKACKSYRLVYKAFISFSGNRILKILKKIFKKIKCTGKQFWRFYLCSTAVLLLLTKAKIKITKTFHWH